MTHFLLVAAGGGIGASLRHLANLAAFAALGTGISLEHVFVNIAGSLAMGLLVGWLARRGGTHELRLFPGNRRPRRLHHLSAFSLDFAVLWERGAVAAAFGYALSSVVLSVAGGVRGTLADAGRGMNAVENITVAADETGMRLDRWFKSHYPGLGFGQLQKLLRSGQIRVDGGRVKTDTRLSPGQSVRIPPAVTSLKGESAALLASR